MIIYTEKEKKLVIPSGLGNFTKNYDEGFDQGYESGYESGSTDGFNTGYESGSTDGKSEQAQIDDAKLTDELTITENGEYTADYGYKKVSVWVNAVPYDEIHYTTTDRNIVEPYSGATTPFIGENGEVLTIVSNTYTDGKGVIKLSGTLKGLGEQAFYICSSLVSINIPDGVTSIGSNAFRSCYSLVSVTIGDSVTSIGEEAFELCSSLVSVTIGDSVTSIESYAFFISSKLSYIRALPTTAPTLDGCCWFTSIKRSGVLEIPLGSDYSSWLSQLPSGWKIKEAIPTDEIWYTSTDGNIVEPSLESTTPFIGENGEALTIVSNTYIDGRCVIKLSGNLKEIGSNVFENCSKLTSINIPDGVTSIGEKAFYNCSSLTSINIPNGVTSIGNYVFENCSKLTSINIPNGVTSIGDASFRNCSSLTSINIPNGVTSIGIYVFQNCSSLASINIPNGVTSIRGYTFYKCSSLTSVTIGDSVTSIGSNTFYNCSSLTSINIPNGVTSIEYGVFENCSKLASITIPDGVTSIRGRAFYNCSSLTSVNIPNGVTSIGDGVFYNCSSLTSITIPNSVTSIGEEAFELCSSLNYIRALPTTAPVLRWLMFYNLSSTGKLIYPADSNYDTWKSALPSGWTTDVPQQQIWYTTTDGNALTLNSAASFKLDDTVLSVVSNTYTERMGVITLSGEFNGIYGAFDNCTTLKEIFLPSNSSYISSFAGCTSLEYVNIWNTQRCGSFAGCTSLKEQKIPSTQTTMPSFSGCTSLEKLDIPATITSIGDNNFNGCDALTEIKVNATTAPTLSDNSFTGLPASGKLIVPTDADYSSWRTALPDGWYIERF